MASCIFQLRSLTAFAVAGIILGWLSAACVTTSPSSVDSVGGVDAGPNGDVIDAGALPDLLPSPGSLLEPRFATALTFAVKGRLNDEAQQQRQQGRLLQAAGSFEAQIDDERVVLDEGPWIYRYASDGQRSLVIESTRADPGGTHARWDRQLARVILELDALAPLDHDRSVDLDGRSVSSASLRHRAIVLRDDGTVLVKDCYTALLDRARQAAARLLVAAPRPTTLDQGDVLHAWGNLPLITDPAKLVAIAAPYGIEAHQGLPCGCYINSAPLPCASWEAQLSKTGGELDCPVPDGLLAPTPETLTLRFKGPIATDGEPSPLPGQARVEARVDGELYQLGVQSSARRYTFNSGVWNGKPIIEISSYGVIKPAGPQRIEADLLLTRLPVALLERLKQDKTYHRPPGPELDLFAMLGRLEQVEHDGAQHAKFCVLAISDVNTSALHVCHDDNQSFAHPEQLQLAASIGLTTSPQALASALGSAEACYCTRDGVGVACASFPAAKD